LIAFGTGALSVFQRKTPKRSKRALVLAYNKRVADSCAGSALLDGRDGRLWRDFDATQSVQRAGGWGQGNSNQVERVFGGGLDGFRAGDG